ncbi:mitochondrial import inner membrane translocase subunit Tim29-like [Asterias amurensis]|uniref:mitochondrial import inner membrane translocase subunit Tim29-like n=1 Tax=Asterias amurensis TaxID=7602 RepID=UPI003AB5E7F2
MAASMVVRKLKVGVFRNAFSRSKVSVPERFKEGWVGKASTYVSNVARDYKGATVDIFTDARARPVKAAVYATAFCCSVVALWNNPDEKSYHVSLQNACNDVLLLSDAIRNPKTNAYIQSLMMLRNEGQIRRMNLVVCSIMWRDNYSKEVNLYDSQCDYMKPGWRDFDKRILDVGFMNRWFFLEKNMVDFDINEEEFEGKMS